MFGVLRHRARIGEELLRYEAMTGLNDEQLTDLVARLHELCGDKFVSAGPPLALGLFRSVALVVCLIRKNVTLWGSRRRPLVLISGFRLPSRTR